MVIQIFLTTCSLFVIWRAFKKYQAKEIRISLFVLWTIFWIALIATVWQPQQTDRLAALLQVGRGADAVLYLSLVFMYYLLFKLFLSFERMHQDITTLVREIAVLKKDTEKEH